MKKIFLSILAGFILIPCCYSQGVAFENDFETAMARSRQTGKPLFITLLGHRNAPSERMINDILSNPEAGEFYSSRFISLCLWNDSAQAQELTGRYGIPYLPAYIFLSPEGDFLSKDVGVKDMEAFLRMGRNYKHPQADALAEYRREFTGGTIDSERLKAYLRLESSFGIRNMEALETLIAMKGGDAVSAEVFDLIKGQPSDVGSIPFRFVVENAYAFAAIIGERETELFIYGKYLGHLRRVPAFLEELRVKDYIYAEALKEHMAVDALLADAGKRDEFVARARKFTDDFPVAAPSLGTAVVRHVNKTEPALEELLVELADKAAAYSKEQALQIARYIVNQYLIIYADLMAVAPWVDRWLEWSGDPDYEKNTTTLVKRATGEYPCENYGMQMPDVILKDLDGNPVALSNLRDSIILIDFWASWCGPCIAKIPRVIAAHEQFKHYPIKFVSITIDRNDDDWKKAVENLSIPWLHLSANGTDMSREYGVRSVPRMIVLDTDGRLIADHITGNTIVAQLERLAEKYNWK